MNPRVRVLEGSTYTTEGIMYSKPVIIVKKNKTSRVMQDPDTKWKVS